MINSNIHFPGDKTSSDSEMENIFLELSELGEDEVKKRNELLDKIRNIIKDSRISYQMKLGKRRNN